ncbi:MAG TPA: hypothetical protein VMH41_12425 [Mycobacteriales bacterium]|nr:hypothetical protein [Mycobacteriales bacterium]
MTGTHDGIDPSRDTLQKALRINLDPRWYGTVAEIGAGQEVARWFFRAGGAAGTVAKTMSAYDMEVSDAVYGKSERYVSLGRLQAMLSHEFDLNTARLGVSRGDSTAFFAFADTVVARSYSGGNECHGWMGVRFQAHPLDEPSQIVLHVRMLDDDAKLQQEALGIVGINLLHAAFFEHHEPEQAIASLLDQLGTGRIEIDMIDFEGIEFRRVDNRLMALRLVQLGLSGVAMFGSDGGVLQPSETLRKRPILVERGSFRPPTVVNIDMLECAVEKFSRDPAVEGKEILTLTELTMRNLLAGGNDVDRRDFLARADLLSACGMTVMISDYVDYHRLAAYLGERTTERIGMVMGVPSLVDLFDESKHLHLPGGILEGFGRLFKNDLRLFVYPMRRSEDGTVVTAGDLSVTDELQPLYDYLSRRGSFVPLDNYTPAFLPILSRDVLRRIAEGDEEWKSMVPPEVAEVIMRRSFFGYRELVSQ